VSLKLICADFPAVIVIAHVFLFLRAAPPEGRLEFCGPFVYLTIEFNIWREKRMADWAL
jgi:hypothetical protein